MAATTLMRYTTTLKGTYLSEWTTHYGICLQLDQKKLYYTWEDSMKDYHRWWMLSREQSNHKTRQFKNVVAKFKYVIQVITEESDLIMNPGKDEARMEGTYRINPRKYISSQEIYGTKRAEILFRYNEWNLFSLLWTQ